MFPLASGLLTHGRSRDAPYPTWPLPHPWSTGCVPVAGITGGANLPTKVVVSLLPVSYSSERNPGSHPSRLTQSLQQATPPFRCSLYSQVLLTWQPCTQHDYNLTWPTAGKYHSKLFSYQTPRVCHRLLVHANRCRLWPSRSAFNQSWHRDLNPGPLRWKLSALLLWAIWTTL